MTGWTTHWLTAFGDAAPWRAVVEAEIAAARDAIARIVEPRPLDILVQSVPRLGIPGIGLNGHQYHAGLIVLTLDPESPEREASLDAGALRRIVAHEYGHCLRGHAGIWHRPTLGDALVSEGLADHLVVEVFGPPSMPWTRPFDAAEWAVIRARAPAARDDRAVSQPAWLFAPDPKAPGDLPRWAGYRLGYALVGAYLDARPEARPHAIAGIPTADLVAEAWPRLFPEDA